MSVKVRTSNVSSILLSDAENAALFNMLGRGCVTMASGVCQLYTADPPGRNRWGKRFCGVVCFIKDNPKRSYYIRLYDIKKDGVIWEQEIYNQFKYKAPREYFHTFEADDVQAGLNFASEDEAIKFKNAVEQKLLERHQKKMERKKQQTMPHSPPAVPPSINAAPAQAPVTNIEIKSGSATVGKSKAGKKDNKKKKLTKDDISTPTAFRHVSHVGWDPTKGFDMNNLDSDMKSLFEQVGISNTSDIDKETVDFIYDFVEQHGGIQKIKEEMKQKPPPPPPQHNLPPQPPPPRRDGPPPPPNRDRVPPPSTRGGPPPPPSRSNLPPPPTPARQMGSPPAPPSFSAPPQPPPQSSKGAPPPAPGPGIPPPPPPPAPPAAPPPPPAAPAAPAVPSGGAGRGALLDSIRGGTSLKPVSDDGGKQGGGGGIGGDPRANLLESIRSGKTLNKVERDEKSSSDDGSQGGGIVGALAMALANRQKQLQMSEDEDEDSSVDDDDEWDD